MTLHTPSFEGVRDAARQIADVAVRTPLIESPALNDRLGGRVLMKAEVLQHAGAFKFRGAYNRISRLTDAEKARGVVAYSSGNHAQAVAAAARMPAAWAWAVLQGMARTSAPAVFNRSAISASTASASSGVRFRSGTWGFMSIRTRMWSASPCAGVRA